MYAKWMASVTVELNWAQDGSRIEKREPEGAHDPAHEAVLDKRTFDAYLYNLHGIQCDPREPQKPSLSPFPLFQRHPIFGTLSNEKRYENNTMASEDTKDANLVHVKSVEEDDDAALRALGYVPSFRREFSNISTVRR
jgi:hypothetical protein